MVVCAGYGTVHLEQKSDSLKGILTGSQFFAYFQVINLIYLSTVNQILGKSEGYNEE